MCRSCRVVGWYHSHPTFPTQPSRIDIYNQVWLALPLPAAICLE